MVDGWNAFFCDNPDDLVSPPMNAFPSAPRAFFPKSRIQTVCRSAACSTDSSRSRRPTPSRWESCGWASCASTPRSSTSRSTSSASAKGNASPPSKSSGPVNASPSKVSRLSRRGSHESLFNVGLCRSIVRSSLFFFRSVRLESQSGCWSFPQK